MKAGIESGRIALAPELGLGGFEVVKVVDQRPPEEGKQKAVGSHAAAPEAAKAAEAEAAEDRYRPMYNVAAAVLVPLVTRESCRRHRRERDRMSALSRTMSGPCPADTARPTLPHPLRTALAAVPTSGSTTARGRHRPATLLR